MSETSYALVVARCLDALGPKFSRWWEEDAARLLRRLHADNERLTADNERLKAERDEAVRAEREACAKVCEQLVSPYAEYRIAEGVGSLRHATLACAVAIRKRGQEPPR